MKREEEEVKLVSKECFDSFVSYIHDSEVQTFPYPILLLQPSIHRLLSCLSPMDKRDACVPNNKAMRSTAILAPSKWAHLPRTFEFTTHPQNTESTSP